jgi:aldehyde dehydrogenase (NAD+)
MTEAIIDDLISFETINKIFEAQQKNAIFVRKTNAEQRIEKLKRILNFNQNNIDKIQQALFADFKKHPTEALIGELMVVNGEIKHLINNLAEWMEPQKVPTTLSMMGSSAWVQFESKGTSLIISPWNYPFNLAIKPVAQAIAAGNTVILKPSEITSHTSKLLKEMIDELFPINEVAVIEGGVDVSTELLRLPFDHIFFTGSPNVGKIVMTAAAKNLSSVTLELGGKSPCIVDETANLKQASERIAWGKLLNNGQTCIAPDYLLVQNSVKDKVVNDLKAAIESMYNADGKGIQHSESYCRIVDGRHFIRLKTLIDDAIQKGAVILYGGQFDESDRFISPTILDNLNSSMKIMNEEIFGPILPVISFETVSEAIDIINNKPKPLAMFINSKKNSIINQILENTSAGGTVINDSIIHYGHTELPFGGVNNSGIGKSGGHWGFLEFSNQRSIVKQKFGTFKMIYPPYTNKIDKIVRFILKYIA